MSEYHKYNAEVSKKQSCKGYLHNTVPVILKRKSNAIHVVNDKTPNTKL